MEVESAVNLNLLSPNVDKDCVAAVILLPNTVLAVLIAAATSTAFATPAVAVACPSVAFDVNVPSATLTVIV